jgi:hypothetical protein
MTKGDNIKETGIWKEGGLLGVNDFTFWPPLFLQEMHKPLNRSMDQAQSMLESITIIPFTVTAILPHFFCKCFFSNSN